MEKITEILKTVGEYMLHSGVPAVLILLAGILVVRIALKLVDKALVKCKLEKAAHSLFHNVIQVVLYGLLALIAADKLGLDVTGVVALASVLTLAVSLSVQNALSNVVGSISLLATQPFHVGDYVEIGSDGGTVEEITMNYTRLLTLDGRTVYIPNSDAASARICNYTVSGRRRVELKFTASYSDDIGKVKAAILQAAKHPKLLADPAPAVVLSAYLDSAVEYTFLGWTAPGDFLEVKNYVNEEVKREFDRENISIPFPQVDVHLQK